MDTNHNNTSIMEIMAMVSQGMCHNNFSIPFGHLAYGGHYILPNDDYVQRNLRIVDTIGTQHFVLCSERSCPLSEVTLYRQYWSTFSVSFVRRFVFFGVSFIGGFTVY